MKATLVFRLFAVILLPLFCIHVSAQLYRVESLVSNVIFTKDKPASFIDQRVQDTQRYRNPSPLTGSARYHRFACDSG